jgi:hypothetical protein
MLDFGEPMLHAVFPAAHVKHKCHSPFIERQVAGDLQRRKLSQPFNCDLIVRLQRNRTYKLSGAIHQIDPRCVLHPVAAFFELDAQGEYLLAGSGESAYALC